MVRLYEIEKDFVQEFEDKIKEQYPLKSFSIFKYGNDLKLNLIAFDKDNQGKGLGTQVMNDIVSFADEHGLRITLTTGLQNDNFGTTSKNRLIKFYKRFGFVENKGKNKDFSISDNMFREPK